MVIFYCDKCGVRVPGADLESGAASSIDEVRALCGRCGGGVSKRRSGGQTVKRITPAVATGAGPPTERTSAAVTRGSSQTGTHPRSAQAAPPPQKTTNKLVLWGSIGAGGCLLLLVFALAALSKKPPDLRNRPTSDAKQDHGGVATNAQSLTMPPLPQPVTETKTSPVVTVVTVENQPPVTVQETRPSTTEVFDPRASVAAGKLALAKTYREKNPDDPWSLDQLLALITSGYRGTPAAQEAEEIRKTLNVNGERPEQRMNWQQDWENLTPNGRDDHWKMDDIWEDRAFVLHTYAPPRRSAQAQFKRNMKVPEDKPWLCFRTRADDACVFHCRIKIDEAEVVSQDVDGKAWHTFCIDLTPKKGQQVNVHVVHDKSGAALVRGNWQAPQFLKEQLAEAQAFALGNKPVVTPVTSEGQNQVKGESPTPAPVASATPAVAPEPDAYAVFLDDLLNALGKQSWEQVRSKLAAAGTDPKLAGHATDVKQDTACATLALKVPEAEIKGASLLQNGPPITLVASDGRRYEIGKQAKVLKVTDKELQIQQRAGGGFLELSLSLSSLSPATREALSQLGLGAGADGTLAMAAYRIGRSRVEATPANRQAIDQLLAEAARKHAPEDQTATLKRWLAFMAAEAEAQSAWTSTEQTLQQKDYAKAREAYDRFRKDFAATAMFASVAPRFPDVEKQLEALFKQPGLWFGCWTSNQGNRFINFLNQDVVRKIGWEDGDKEREKRFPKDWFSLRYGGVLHIDKPGPYTFFVTADDRVRVWIDGNLIVNGTPMDLTQGDHPFRMEYLQDHSTNWLKLEWSPPGEKNKRPIPDDLFFYHPSERERYLQPPDGGQ